MSVAVPDDTSRVRSIPRRALATIDRAGLPVRRPSHGWVYLAILALCLAGGAVTLLLPSTPGGPTLKPLAMVFTAIVAPFGSAAPNLWLAIARAGSLAATTLAFLLTARLSRDAAPALPRPIGLAVAGLAGIAAAGGVLMLQSFIYVTAQGYSEGVLLT